MKLLRLTLKMSPVQFALMIGLSPEQVTNRERGRSTWREAEVAQAKMKVSAHIAAATKTLAALPD